MPRRIVFWYALALVLFAYLALFELAPPDSGGGANGKMRTLVESKPEDVVELYVKNERGSARFRRTGGRWEPVGPAGRSVPPDLIDAIVTNLTSGQRVLVVAEEAAELESFGLADPRAEIHLTIKGRPRPVIVLLGNQIATKTAVYGRLEGSPRIYQVGANVDYYQSQLLFQGGAGEGTGTEGAGGAAASKPG